MSVQRGLDANLRPLQQHQAQVNAPMPAALDLDFAYQVQRMAFAERATSHTYFWWDSDTGPINENSSVNTDADFTLAGGTVSDGTVEIPWLAHPDATLLRAVFYVGVGNTDLILKLRLQTRTLIDSVTTTSGDRVAAIATQPMPRVAHWGDGFYNANIPPYSLAVVSLSVKPDYPADRTDPFVIAPQAYWEASENPTNVTTTRRAGILCARFWDVVEKPDPEA